MCNTSSTNCCRARCYLKWSRRGFRLQMTWLHRVVCFSLFWDEISPLGMITPPAPLYFSTCTILYVLDCHYLTQLLEPFSALTFSSNFTLQYMPLPLSDISQAYRSAPERTEQALTKVGSRWQSSSLHARQHFRINMVVVISCVRHVNSRLSSPSSESGHAGSEQ